MTLEHIELSSIVMLVIYDLTVKLITFENCNLFAMDQIIQKIKRVLGIEEDEEEEVREE